MRHHYASQAVGQSDGQSVSRSANPNRQQNHPRTPRPHTHLSISYLHTTPISPSRTYTPTSTPPPSQFHFIRCCFFVCSTTLGSPRDLFYPLLLRCMFSAPYLINHHAVHDLRLQERPGRARAPLHHHVLADACPQFVGGMIHVRAGKEGGRLVGKGGGMVHIRGVVCSVGGGGVIHVGAGKDGGRLVGEGGGTIHVGAGKEGMSE